MLLPDDLEPPPFTDDDLDEYFEWLDHRDDEIPEAIDTEQGLEAPPAPVVAAWSVCDTGSAEYAMRKLGHAEALIAQRDAEAATFHRQIDRWLAGQIARPKKAVNFFTGQLEAYARRRRELEGEKTLKLPSGDVTSRLNPARPAVADDKPTRAAFIEWARDRELPLVKPTWSPVIDEIKKAVVFRTVVGPARGEVGQQVYDVDDHLVLLPASVAEDVVGQLLEGMNVDSLLSGGSFEERPHTAIYRRDDGSWWLVPGVVQVPEEVTYTVKPAKP
jgi:hypothetical protein